MSKKKIILSSSRIHQAWQKITINELVNISYLEMLKDGK